MSFLSNAMRRTGDTPDILTAEVIVGNPLFATALRDAALILIAMHDVTPRIVRYTADMKRWMLTQAILAFHFQHLTTPAHPALTAANLVTFITANKVASKNTAVAHLAEMRNYRLLLDAGPTGDKRSHPLKLADNAEVLIREWFDGHLKSLDMLDGGTRYAQSLADARLLRHAQPEMCQRLFHDRQWSSPPETVDAFVRTASGSNFLHDLMSRLGPDQVLEARIPVGPLRIGDLAKRYIISRSHAQRVFVRARTLNIVGWELAGNGGDFWISERLVRDYRRWQAAKFAAVEEAFQLAVNHLSAGH